MAVLTTSPVADARDLYPIHEEDHVVQGPAHYRQCSYLVEALQAQSPDRWVLGDACLYWEEGNKDRYVAPDLAVVDCPPPDPLPSVYLRWADPPLLFVGEVASESTAQQDLGPKAYIYEQALVVPEYLYANADRNDLRLWRLDQGRYRPVERQPDGRVWSEQAGLFFGFDPSGFLRLYTADGTMLLTLAEERKRAEEAERRLAEAMAELERLRGSSRAP